MKVLNLKNNITACVKQNSNTPRIAFVIDLSINKAEDYAGEYSLVERLLSQGTKTYSAQELATVLDENAIELNVEMRYDYLRFRFVCLNEDFELALSILSDMIQNSTFNDFEKERIKLKGEIEAELDSAKVKVTDLFTRNIYKDHFYGNTLTKIIEEVDKVTQEDVKEVYKNIYESSYKVVTIVGDNIGDIEGLLNKYLGNIPNNDLPVINIPKPQAIKSSVKTECIKADAQQAQIIQGWLVPTIGSKDYAKLKLLNIILGASGLSSRLFLELREKKGLAYTVRTAYDIRKNSGVFSIYIGTEPLNIQTSIEGFKIEIEKIKQELISEEELQAAKNNIIGKQLYLTETNSQQAALMSHYAIMGKTFDYQKEFMSQIKTITAQDLIECANKYFSDNYVLAIIRP